MTRKYKPTHVSVFDGSTAMTEGYDEDDARIMLVNEDGQRWTDPTHHWRRIADEPRRYTVSGNNVRITRLSPTGEPLGEPIDLSVLGALDFDVSGDDVLDSYYDYANDEFVMEVSFDAVDTSLLALMTGQPTGARRRLGWTERLRLMRWIRKSVRR